VTEPRPLMTPDQLCEFLQCSKDWLYEQVQAGRIPYVPIGRRSYRFRPEDIETWLAEKAANVKKEQ
jgi:excisionase family DNA binding protein